MKCETIPVTVGGTVQAKLSLYIQEDYPETYGERKRPLVLICPGGGACCAPLPDSGMPCGGTLV